VSPGGDKFGIISDACLLAGRRSAQTKCAKNSGHFPPSFSDLALSVCGPAPGHVFRVLCPARVLLLVPALRSSGSPASRPALFVGLSATMAESDFPRPFVIGYGSSPPRGRPPIRDDWLNAGSPGSRATSFHTCQVLRPRPRRSRSHPCLQRLPPSQRRRVPCRHRAAPRR
jgi:hypothetical protein